MYNCICCAPFHLIQYDSCHQVMIQFMFYYFAFRSEVSVMMYVLGLSLISFYPLLFECILLVWYSWRITQSTQSIWDIRFWILLIWYFSNYLLRDLHVGIMPSVLIYDVFITMRPATAGCCSCFDMAKCIIIIMLCVRGALWLRDMFTGACCIISICAQYLQLYVSMLATTAAVAVLLLLLWS